MRERFIKISRLSRNRIKYIVAPNGFAEKARLAKCHMDHSIRCFREVRKKIEFTYEQMMFADAKNILLWGDARLPNSVIYQHADFR